MFANKSSKQKIVPTFCKKLEQKKLCYCSKKKYPGYQVSLVSVYESGSQTVEDTVT